MGEILATTLPRLAYRLPSNKALMRHLADSVGEHEDTPQTVIEDFLESNPMPYRRSAWKTVTDTFWGYDGRDDIDRIKCPTLVIHGPADGIFPLDMARNTTGRLPNSAFCRLELTGHIGMIERPAMYKSLLRAVRTTVETSQPLVDAVGDATEEE